MLAVGLTQKKRVDPYESAALHPELFVGPGSVGMKMQF